MGRLLSLPTPNWKWAHHRSICLLQEEEVLSLKVEQHTHTNRHPAGQQLLGIFPSLSPDAHSLPMAVFIGEGKKKREPVLLASPFTDPENAPENGGESPRSNATHRFSPGANFG